jgi:NADH:ubiquinone oxidoreductase subunit E
MAVETKESKTHMKEVDKIIMEHGADGDELIPILLDVNRALGYLSPDAMEQIGEQLHIPGSRVSSVASFYDMLSFAPQGKHVIKFCESAPCHVEGGREVWQALQHELKIGNGETTQDKKWTLKTTSCIGMCAEGPVILIDDEIISHITAEMVPQILARYK